MPTSEAVADDEPEATMTERHPLSAAIRRAALALPAATGAAMANALAVLALSAAGLALREMAFAARAAALLSVMAAGGALGGFLAWTAAAAVAGVRPASARFAAMLAALPAATVSGVWLVYFLWDLWVHGPGNEPIPSFAWAVEMLYAVATTAYIVLASALPLLMPAAIVPILAAAFVFARRPRG